MVSGLISIIIPFYNVDPRYFEKCIDSVLEQEYKDYELIIVDDGSLPKYQQFLENIKQRDERISLFHRNNSGVAEARNFGLSKAKGEAVCFIDADDYISQWMLNDLWNAYKTSDTGAAVARYKLTFSETDVFSRRQKSYIVENSVLLDTALIGMNCKPSADGYLSAGPVAALYNMEIAQSISFPKGIKYMEDVIWNYQFFLKVDKVTVVDECVYAYRQYKNSSTHLYSLNMIEERKNALKALQGLYALENEWYALRLFANYSICCKGIMRTDEIHSFLGRIKKVHQLDKDPIWDGYKKRGVDKKWDKKYRIKRAMAILRILPLVYTIKEF